MSVAAALPKPTLSATQLSRAREEVVLKCRNGNFSPEHCRAAITWLPDVYDVFLTGFLSLRDFSIILIAISTPSQAKSLPFLGAPELIFELLEPCANIPIQFAIHINIFTQQLSISSKNLGSFQIYSSRLTWFWLKLFMHILSRLQHLQSELSKTLHIPWKRHRISQKPDQ